MPSLPARRNITIDNTLYVEVSDLPDNPILREEREDEIAALFQDSRSCIPPLACPDGLGAEVNAPSGPIRRSDIFFEKS
jgi:hypothetical protein